MRTLTTMRLRVGKSLSALAIGGIVVLTAGCDSNSEEITPPSSPHNQVSEGTEEVREAPLSVSDISVTRFEDRKFVLTASDANSATIKVSDRAGNFEEPHVVVGKTATGLGITFELEMVSAAEKTGSDEVGGNANVASIRVHSVSVPTHLPGYAVKSGEEITATGSNPGLAWPIWFEFASGGPEGFMLVARNTEDVDKSNAVDLAPGNRIEQAGGEFEIVEVSGTDGPLIDVSAVIRVITPPSS